MQFKKNQKKKPKHYLCEEINNEYISLLVFVKKIIFI